MLKLHTSFKDAIKPVPTDFNCALLSTSFKSALIDFLAYERVFRKPPRPPQLPRPSTHDPRPTTLDPRLNFLKHFGLFII